MFKAIDRFIAWWGRRVPLMMLCTLLYVVYSLATYPYDPTDNEQTKTRSGLYFYVDHGTGCQYIKASWFATLTPRVDKEGRHICHG